MGKLTIKEVDDLSAAGILDKKTVTELQTKGLVGTRKRGVKYYLKNGNKGKVYPTLYFSGLGKKDKPNQQMKSFRDEFNKLLTKYGIKE
jgi:hypothetical protein